MTTLALALLVALAGFLVFPVVIGLFALSRGGMSRLWVAVALWSLSVALLLIVTVGLLAPDVPEQWLGPLLSVRHVLLFATMMAMFLTIHGLVGRLPRVLVGAIVVLFVIRTFLWFFTDLVWTHTFTAAGAPIYGPLRNPLALLVTVLAAGVVTWASVWPWRSEFERRAMRFAIVPGFIVGVLGSYFPGELGEYMIAVAFVPGLVAVEIMYLAELRRQNKRTEILADREQRLVSFGADTLATPGVSPPVAAIELISTTLDTPGCAFVDVRDGAAYIVARKGSLTPPPDWRIISAPVGPDGSDGDLRVVVHQNDTDEASFVEAVAFMVSAALRRQQLEVELRASSLRDALTGLPNWALLEDRVTALLGQPRQTPVAVLCIDVDDLRGINEEFGHAAGDSVLCALAARLQSISSPRGTAARIGSDQFILAEPATSEAAAAALARQVVGRGTQIVEVGGLSVAYDFRVGIAVADGPQAGADRVVRDAELAMRRAKRDSVPIATFTDLGRTVESARRRFNRELHHAVEHGDITLQFQPIVDLATTTIAGVEALARWRDEDGEQVPPLTFIPVAEDTGLILPLGEHVLESAVRQLAAWTQHQPALGGLRMSVNVAPRQLADESLPTKLSNWLSECDVAADRLVMEVTETGLEQDPATAARQLLQFREIGVGLSLDDFGTGHSTLERLMSLPVTALKIDRQFVTATDPSARMIVRAVVGMAHGCGLSVVAEGIETDEQLRLVRSDECELGQGYVFSRPLDAEAVPQLSLPAQGADAAAATVLLETSG